MRGLLLLLLATLPVAPALAQPVPPQQASPDGCAAEVARSDRLNVPELLRGAALCRTVNRPVEASFLFLASIVRGMVDAQIIPPANPADSEDRELADLVAAARGTSSSLELLRNPASRAQLLAMYDAWTPAYGPEYSFGRAAALRPEPAIYLAAIADIKRSMRSQIETSIRILSDDVIYRLERRRAEIWEPTRTPET